MPQLLPQLYGVQRARSLKKCSGCVASADKTASTVTTRDVAARDAACNEFHQRSSGPDSPPPCAPKLATGRRMNSQTPSSDLNITTHRASESVWNRRGWDGTREPLAFSRWLVAFGGGALVVQGLRQRSVIGAMLAGIGSSLAWWAISGEGDLSGAQRRIGALLERAPWRRGDCVKPMPPPIRSRPAMRRAGRRPPARSARRSHPDDPSRVPGPDRLD